MSNKDQAQEVKAENLQGIENPEEAATGKIVWDDRTMKSEYANIANVATTNDEIMLLFGTSQAWNNAQKDVLVSLTNRIIMTPATAKRFMAVLSKTLDEFEKKKA
ncbi:DUF3467 domain-containing protein [Maridesulfovibrio frigidus]|uniref:DUF3467 domain-containing protein n=1 Tax=Maridesulfovibrio frigidus TaxID=340956 RepID=UPI000691D533|nr:DUF3467 domain-containing protein [Maridesulfovibrio frigidus]